MKDSKKYYKDVKKCFPCKGKRERDFLKHFKEQVIEYDNDVKICTYEELAYRFGEPKDVFKSYYDNTDGSYLS